MRNSFGRRLLLLVVIGGTSALTSCSMVGGSGIPGEITQELDTAGTTELSVCCGLEVHAWQGTSQTVTISGDDNLVDDVMVRAVDGRVEVLWRDESIVYNPSLPMVIALELPELALLESSGGSVVEFGPLESTNLVLNQSGGGRAEFASVVADVVQMDVSGGGTFEIAALDVDALELLSSGGSVTEFAGRSPALTVDVSGGGQLLAFELDVADAEVILSGGTVAELSATGSVTGEASGGSVVTVRGGADVELTLSGGSTVTEE